VAKLAIEPPPGDDYRGFYDVTPVKGRKKGQNLLLSYPTWGLARAVYAWPVGQTMRGPNLCRIGTLGTTWGGIVEAVVGEVEPFTDSVTEVYLIHFEDGVVDEALAQRLKVAKLMLKNYLYYNPKALV